MPYHNFDPDLDCKNACCYWKNDTKATTTAKMQPLDTFVTIVSLPLRFL